MPAQKWIFHLLLQVFSTLKTVQLKDHLAEWHNKNAVNYVSAMNGTIAAVDTDHGNQMKDDSINQEQQPRTHFLGHKQIRGGGGGNQGSEVEKM